MRTSTHTSTHSFYRDKVSEGKVVREEYLSYSIPRELEMKNRVTFCYKRSSLWNNSRLLWMCICAEINDMNLQLIIKGKFWVHLCSLCDAINAQTLSLLLGIVTVLRFQFTEVLKSHWLYVMANIQRSLSISVVWMGLVTWDFYIALVWSWFNQRMQSVHSVV